tara:strand:+ start:248 stop:928 length:681 start_codon:yes stop_codon:yes gene_type:complete
MRTPDRHRDILRRLLIGVAAFLVLTTAVAEEAPLPPEILQQEAAEIILGQVESRTVVERADDRNLNRDITYDVRVEETQKGTLRQGTVIKVRATTITFMGEGAPPPGPSGHHPLPLVGELARFFLTPGEDGDYLILSPNGVELNQEVSISDPVRRGADAVAMPPAEAEADDAEEPSSKDPFGWDVILILLGLPILVGGLRQKGSARLGLLGVAMVFFLCAIAIVLS